MRCIECGGKQHSSSDQSSKEASFEVVRREKSGGWSSREARSVSSAGLIVNVTLR